jgi:hypothetical protein
MDIYTDSDADININTEISKDTYGKYEKKKGEGGKKGRREGGKVGRQAGWKGKEGRKVEWCRVK